MADSSVLELQLGGDDHIELLLALEAGEQLPPGICLIQSASAKVRKQAAMRLGKALGRRVFPVSLGGVRADTVEDTALSLNALFTRAESSSALLFFDEADALFGAKPKRDEIVSAALREQIEALEVCVLAGVIGTKSAGKFWQGFVSVALREA